MKQWLVLTLSMLLLFSVAGCQSASKTKTISIGLLADLTGPTSALSGIAYAGRDYFVYYNEKYGGINGVPLTSELINTAYELSKRWPVIKSLSTN